jgi:hypothetical protein
MKRRTSPALVTDDVELERQPSKDFHDSGFARLGQQAAGYFGGLAQQYFGLAHFKSLFSVGGRILGALQQNEHVRGIYQ